MGLQVLLPSGKTVEEAVGNLRAQPAPADRPYVIANFVATVDGAVTLQGESGTIARYAPGDRPLFRLLREQVDAVLAGTTTLAREGYRRLLRDEAVLDRREAAGIRRDPLAVILSRSGDIPSGIPMLEDDRQPRRIFTGAAAKDQAGALRALRHEEGVELLLCEGGPSLLGSLVRARLIDEIFLTISPVLATGHADTTLLGGDPGEAQPMELRALLEERGGLHARYAILGGAGTSLVDHTSGDLQPR